MTHTINRRKALTVVAAAPAAVAMGTVPVLAGEGQDRLLTLVRSFERELAFIDAIDDPNDEEIAAWQDRADGILGEAASLPCLTAASAMAVLDVILKDDMLNNCSIWADEFTAMLRSVKVYIEGRVA